MKMNLAAGNSIVESLTEANLAYVLASSELVNQLIGNDQMPKSGRFIHTDHGALEANTQEVIEEKGISLLISAGMNETCSIFSANTRGRSRKPCEDARPWSSGPSASKGCGCGESLPRTV